VKTFDHVLQIKPDSAYAHAQLGKAFTYLGNSQAAVDEFNRAFRIQPKLRNDAACQGPFASALAKLGQIDKALDAYREAARLDQKSAEAQFGFGWALFNLEKYSEAEQPCGPRQSLILITPTRTTTSGWRCMNSNRESRRGST
jgi:protein O-GlcNAc transferase